jgi:hypothetical protein
MKFDTCATGVNGYTMAQRHLRGKKALRAFLPEARGLYHRLPENLPQGPIFHEPRSVCQEPTADFMLERAASGSTAARTTPSASKWCWTVAGSRP